MGPKTWSLAVAAVALSASFVHANDESPLGVGTTVFVTMTGELAEKYLEQMGSLPTNTKGCNSPSALMQLPQVVSLLHIEMLVL